MAAKKKASRRKKVASREKQATGGRARTAQQRLAAAVAKQLPNYRLVEDEPDPESDADATQFAPGDATGPSLAELRRKFLGEDADRATPEVAADSGKKKKKGKKKKARLRTKRVEPRHSDDQVHGSGQKIVLVDDDDEIVGMQG